MSVCVSCGVDQETGLRVGLDDDLAPPPPPPLSGPPVHVAVIGGLLGVAAITMLIFSLARSVGGPGGLQNYGWLGLAIVSGFGIFATVQFVRLKTAKLLMVALTLGVVIDLMAMIALPLIQANLEDQDRMIVPGPTRMIPTTRAYISSLPRSCSIRAPCHWASPSWWSMPCWRST